VSTWGCGDLPTSWFSGRAAAVQAPTSCLMTAKRVLDRGPAPTVTGERVLVRTMRQKDAEAALESLPCCRVRQRGR